MAQSFLPEFRSNYGITGINSPTKTELPLTPQFGTALSRALAGLAKKFNALFV